MATEEIETGQDQLRRRLQLVQHVPQFYQHFLLIGMDAAETGYALKKRDGVTVHALATNDAERALALQLLDGASGVDELGGEVWRGRFDCVLFGVHALDLLNAPAFREGLISALSPYGQVLAIAPNNAYWRTLDKGKAGVANAQELTITKFTEAGLAHYNSWPLLDLAFPPYLDGALPIVHEGKEFPAADEAARDRLATQLYYLCFILPGYDPMAHANYFLEIGQPARAYRALESIPLPYLTNDAIHANIASGMSLALLEQVKAGEIDAAVAFSASGRNLLYRALALEPAHAMTYTLMAEFWTALGSKSMAVRTLRLLAQLQGDRALLARLPLQPEVAPLTEAFDRPPMNVPVPEDFRVLFITHPRPHYGLDVLYDGLCQVLGPLHVDEYPWKAVLHGQMPEELKQYPCTFDHPGNPVLFDELLERLRQGYYDCVIYGDVERSLPEEEVIALGQAAARTPIFIADGLDDFINTRHWLQAYPGFPEAAGYLKREMLHCVDYGPNAFPMPFAYDRSRGVEDFTRERSQDLFWAGHRKYGTRRAYLEAVEQRLGHRLDAIYEPDEYTRRMRESCMGLNFYGMGYDTVRYWELAANGSMILSERLPIYIPYNFQDGVSAVFFDDLDELLEKLDYYLNRREESLDIAERGHAHFLSYHTCAARARQALGWILGRMEALRQTDSADQS